MINQIARASAEYLQPFMESGIEIISEVHDAYPPNPCREILQYTDCQIRCEKVHCGSLIFMEDKVEISSRVAPIGSGLAYNGWLGGYVLTRIEYTNPDFLDQLLKGTLEIVEQYFYYSAINDPLKYYGRYSRAFERA